jgi:lipid A 3-O-deacylase
MKAAVFVLLLCTASMFAQDADSSANPLHQKGTWDLGGWVQGGHSVTGGVSGVGAFSAGFRVGKILTKEKGKGWYRGNLEVAADAIPVALIFQQRVPINVICIPEFPEPCQPRDQTVYGGGFNPLMFIWNFSGPKKITPYAELGGGVLFTKSDVPAFTSDVNFMPQIAFGVHLLRRKRQSVSLAGRYLHISNAGLGDLNPGINTFQFTIGYHWFR